MTESVQLHMPSKDQIVAAIYETVLRPELFDRFCPKQQVDPISPHSALQTGENPIFAAPELRAHFARAIEILEQQWIQLGQPDPLKAYENSWLFDENCDRAPYPRRWLLLDPKGALLAASRQIKIELGKSLQTARQAEHWLRLLPQSKPLFQKFLQRVSTRELAWYDMLVLETSLAQQKLLCRPVWSGDPQAPMAVMIEFLDLKCHPGAQDYVAQAFGLDAQESILLWQLLQGRINCISSEGTLRGIASKAGAPGIAELIRLACFLVQEYASDAAISEGLVLPPCTQFRGPDGRETQCFRLGAETGQPVIFVHGMMDGIAGIQRMQSLLRAAGFRVYAPMRGGYGSSTPPPERNDQLGAFVTQIEALIDQENLQRPILLGQRSGTIFARAAALRLRHRIGGSVGVAPTPPLKGAQDYKTLRGYHRALALSAQFAPFLLPYVLRNWSRSIERSGAATLVKRQAKPGSKALEQLTQMPLDPVLSLSQTLMMQQDGSGFLSDLMLAASDWHSQLLGRAGPAIYLCGDEETALRQDKLFSGAMGMEQIQMRICGDAGNVLLYVRPELIISTLGELSRHRENSST